MYEKTVVLYYWSFFSVIFCFYRNPPFGADMLGYEAIGAIQGATLVLGRNRLLGYW